MKNLRLTIGDIFEAPLGDNTKKYFQYIGVDDSQLGSDVIRVFSDLHVIAEDPDPSAVVLGPVDFYAHCIIRLGTKRGFWRKVGNSSEVGTDEILFRSTKDFGRDWIKVSERWEVWKFGQQRKFVGRLPDALVSAEYGTVFPPYEIVFRMKNGRYKQTFQS